MIDRPEQGVATTQGGKIFLSKGIGTPQTLESCRSRTVLAFVRNVVPQLQVAGSKIDIEHATRPVLDVDSSVACLLPFLLFQTVAHVTGLLFQLIRIAPACGLVDRVAGVR